MDERLKFVARRLVGEPMAELCREFGISRKTGYKIFDRYQECGIHGLTCHIAVLEWVGARCSVEDQTSDNEVSDDVWPRTAIWYLQRPPELPIHPETIPSTRPARCHDRDVDFGRK